MQGRAKWSTHLPCIRGTAGAGEDVKRVGSHPYLWGTLNAVELDSQTTNKKVETCTDGDKCQTPGQQGGSGDRIRLQGPGNRKHLRGGLRKGRVSGS